MNEAHTSNQSAKREAQLREAFSLQVQTGNRDHAIQFARLLLKEFASAKTYRYLGKVVSSESVVDFGLKPYRIALLSSFSIEFMKDALFALGVANGLLIDFYQTGFGAFRQEILNPSSGLYQKPMDLTILAVEGEDWLPEIYGRYTLYSSNLITIKENFKHELTGLLEKFRSYSHSPILIHDLAQPLYCLLGIAEGSNQLGQRELVHDLNKLLHELCSRYSDAFVVNYQTLVSRVGGNHWYDLRMKHYARFPLSQEAIGELAREYMKYCRSLLGYSKKCLVVDLDNTLWGGVLGEDGLEGIKLGPTYPGSAFIDFQQQILGLHSRGVILAVASKNNQQDVEEVFAKHSSMILRRTDFSAFEVHWNAKVESLKHIAYQLNIGLEHMVFVDDNPVECEQVRMHLPMVTVILLPPQPEQYSQALLEEGWFDTLSISTEDIKRSALYEQRAQAEALRETSTDLEGFYRDLDMTLDFSPVSAKNLARAAQLTQKTNQFNATTRRYTEGEITKCLHDPAWITAVVSVTDRFGDNGIVGLMLAHLAEQELIIDTFLLSCRVIGRTVETAMLAYLCEIAGTVNAKYLMGEIIPTQKNPPVRDLFERHGFALDNTGETGNSYWRLNCETSKVEYPAWFKFIKNQ